MAPSFSKNSILKGTVDYYCLVCDKYLKSESDNIDHISNLIHKENLDSTQYVKDFESDFVRKIKNIYFCELCNELLPMMARVRIHINEMSHVVKKNQKFFKRIGDNVIAFGKVVLNEKAWNGLNDESCAFCNTEFEDEEKHKNLSSHIIKIIQVQLEVDENKNIYRKIDDVSFHCLTCNMVLALKNIKCHFEEDQHKNRYQECCTISLNKIKEDSFLEIPCIETGVNLEQTHTAENSGVNTKCDDLEDTTAHAAIPNKVVEKEKGTKTAQNFDVNQEIKEPKDSSENCDAIALNKAGETKEECNVAKDIVVNKKNKNTANKKVKKIRTKAKPSEYNIEEYEKKICKVLKAEDYITVDENGKTLCILCDWIMDARNKQLHINGEHHQFIEKLHKKRLAGMVSNNIKDITVLQNTSILDSVTDFQANSININLISNTAVCKKCTINLPYDTKAIKEHILKHSTDTYKHENKVNLPLCETIDKETCEETNELTVKDKNNEGKAVKNENKGKSDCVEDKKKKKNYKGNAVKNENKKNSDCVKEKNNEGNSLKNENDENSDCVKDKYQEKINKGNSVKNENEENSDCVDKNKEKINEGNSVENENVENSDCVTDKNKEKNYEGNAVKNENDENTDCVDKNKEGNAVKNKNDENSDCVDYKNKEINSVKNENEENSDCVEDKNKEENNEGNAVKNENKENSDFVEDKNKEKMNEGNSVKNKNDENSDCVDDKNKEGNVKNENSDCIEDKNKEGSAVKNENKENSDYVEDKNKKKKNEGNSVKNENYENSDCVDDKNNEGNAVKNENEKNSDCVDDKNKEGNAVKNENEENSGCVDDKNKEKNHEGNAVKNENEENSDCVDDKNKEGNSVKNENEENSGCVDDKNENDKPASLVKCDEELNLNETSLQDEAEIAISQSSVPEKLLKQSLENYIKVITGIKHMIFKDIVINDILCIAVSSFHYLISIKGEVKCLICDEIVPDNETHMIKPTHMQLLNQKPVILNEESEFIREINPELLHCGFCNTTVTSWSEMQKHFNGPLHKEAKNASEWRMQLFLDENNAHNYYKTSSDFSTLSIRAILSGLT